ncbi:MULTISPECIES: L,D-transpeptidase family protein [unclassified Helicobacter]|uniref:L,D-transpeptidase family protein n=1 Tax=unclassified Helicobacter TaxID=2593540 RepID=UPI000CF10D0A|nr:MULTISPECIES: L,D-transpeptidase family protein [unclassified Helicobacter]
MLKKTLLSFLLMSVFYGQQNEVGKIIQEYRLNGINSVQKTLEGFLSQRKYWLDMLQNQDTDFGYYEDINFLFISDKASLKLWLYKVDDGRLTQLGQVDSIVGIGDGAKKIEGDKITPIGVYSFVDKFQKLDQYYGPMAFATNYPNIYDRRLKRTGSGIWIHGKPLNGDRKEKNTRGCIAIENNFITEFDKLIDFKKTILISYETSLPKVSKEELASILAMLYQWKNAWMENDIKKYLNFYSQDFKRADGMSFKRFSDYKTRVFQKKEQKNIDFTKINISPYPNVENKNLFRVSYMQKYTAYKNKVVTYDSYDAKELYIEVKQDKPLILIEK